MRYTLTHTTRQNRQKTHIQNPEVHTKTLCGDHVDQFVYGAPEHPVCERCAYYYQRMA